MPQVEKDCAEASPTPPRYASGLGDGDSCSESPVEEEPPDKSHTNTATAIELGSGSSELFSQFPEAIGVGRSSKGRFSTAQPNDLNLDQAWRNAAVMEGEIQGWVSEVTYPHLCVKNAMLYRVIQQREGNVWRSY